jgi:cytoskeletal protein RodZ
MYCATCGSLLNQELNYCNRCGARVDKLAVSENKSEALQYLSMATGFVGLGGLGLTVGLIARKNVFENSQLNSPNTAQLEEPRIPAASVTENTTRTLEKELIK